MYNLTCKVFEAVLRKGILLFHFLLKRWVQYIKIMIKTLSQNRSGGKWEEKEKV